LHLIAAGSSPECIEKLKSNKFNLKTCMNALNETEKLLHGCYKRVYHISKVPSYGNKNVTSFREKWLSMSCEELLVATENATANCIAQRQINTDRTEQCLADLIGAVNDLKVLSLYPDTTTSTQAPVPTTPHRFDPLALMPTEFLAEAPDYVPPPTRPPWHSTEPLLHRDKRQLLAAAALVTGAIGTFIGLYNSHELHEIRNELLTLSDQHNLLTNVVKRHEHMLASLDTQLLHLTNVVETLIVHNPALVYAELNRNIQAIESQLEILFETFQCKTLLWILLPSPSFLILIELFQFLLVKRIKPISLFWILTEMPPLQR
jgi:hypothetical protein